MQETETYRNVAFEELAVELFSHFQRHQVVTKCWRKRDGEWEIQDAPFVDDWGTEEYKILVDCLKNTLTTFGGGKSSVLSKSWLYVGRGM